MKPLAAGEREKFTEFLGDGTDDRCALNQYWSQKLLQAHDYWRQQIADSYPIEFYGSHDSQRCYFCQRDYYERYAIESEENHDAGCAWFIARTVA